MSTNVRKGLIAGGLALAGLIVLVMVFAYGGARAPKATLYSFVSDEGLSLEINGMDGGYDGFWCWPAKRLYGRLYGRRSGIGRLSLDLPASDGSNRSLEGRFLLFSGDIDAKLVERTDAQAASKAGGMDIRLKRARGTASAESVLESGAYSTRIDVLGREAAFAARLTGKAEASDGKGGRLPEAERGIFSEFSLSTVSPRTDALGPIFDEALRRGLESGAYAASLREAFAADILALHGPAVPARPLEFRERQFPVGRAGKYLSVATERYYFSGGAHGNTVTSFRAFDLQNGKTLLLREILATEVAASPVTEEKTTRAADATRGIETIAGLLHKEARRILKLAPGQPFTEAGFFEDALPLSEDWFACPAGLGFHYDRYELAAYARGDFYFVVPWAELAGIVDPGLTDAFAGAAIPLDTK